MLNLRIVTPADSSERVTTALRRHPGVTNILRFPGAAVEPEGDVVLADVARESANGVLEMLRTEGCTTRGSIAVETVDVALSEVADEAVAAAPGSPSDAVVWEEVTARTNEEATL